MISQPAADAVVNVVPFKLIWSKSKVFKRVLVDSCLHSLELIEQVKKKQNRGFVKISIPPFSWEKTCLAPSVDWRKEEEELVI